MGAATRSQRRQADRRLGNWRSVYARHRIQERQGRHRDDPRQVDHERDDPTRWDPLHRGQRLASGNAVDFRVGHSEAGPIKEMLTALVLGNHPTQHAPQQAAAEAMAGAGPRQDPRTSITDELRKLADLRDAGVVTEAEFSAKKAELLARL